MKDGNAGLHFAIEVAREIANEVKVHG